MEQENVSKDFSKRFGTDLHKTLIKIYVFDDYDEIEIPCYIY